MRFDFRADPVFQRSDDLSACRVVFGIGGKNHRDIQGKTNRVAFNLNVALLHDVEQSDLNLACQIRKLIDRENSSIGSRKKAVMHTELAADGMSTFCGLDGID